MSGVTALVDTLLATRLAQRVDLIPLKPQVEIAGPVSAARADKVTNDVRLPSRAALEQLGVDLSGSRKDKPDARLPATTGVTLSAVARAISVILDPQMGPALKVRSAEPLWPQSRPPVALLLTARLSQTVVYSGLFYESHLQQFAAGLRPLAQLVREPQAGLAAELDSRPLPIELTDSAAPLAAARPTAGTAVNALPAVPGAGPTAAPFAAVPAAGASAVSGETLPLAVVYDRDGKPEKSLPPLRDMAAQVADSKAPFPGPAGDKDSSSAVTVAIHPDAVGLVRQQLELLAVPVFRWVGEAWPGTPMEWDLKQEPAEDTGAPEGEAPQAAWTTNLTLTLPTLKGVQARLTLVGDTVLVQVTCDENATLAALDEARSSLAGRFDALGLQLTTLQVGMTSAEDGAAQSAS